MRVFSERVANAKTKDVDSVLRKSSPPHPDPAKHAYASPHWGEGKMFPLPSGERIKVRGKIKLKNLVSFKSLDFIFLLILFTTKIEKSHK